MNHQPHEQPLVRAEIYLDHNATTPVLPQAAAEVQRLMQQHFGNPSSSHSTGLKAKAELELTRHLARQLIGADTGNIVFTSGATEGIQTSVVSALLAIRERGLALPETLLLYGATEHKAVPESLKHWNKVLQVNARMQAIPVDRHGLICLDSLAQLLPKAALVCTMAVNNETGVMQDVAALEQLIRKIKPDAYWLVDCVQALGKFALNLAASTIDYAPFSGHKLYGPKGVGFLYVRAGAPYQPFIAGGGQESGLRSGTENLPAIAAMRRIFELQLDAAAGVFQPPAVLWQYREALLAALRQVFPALVLNSDAPYIVPTTINFSVPGFLSKEILDLFDAAGIRVSSGSACSSKVLGSFVLDAMGLESWRSEGAIRLSFGPAFSAAECEAACQAIRALANVVTEHCLVLTDVSAVVEPHADGLLQLKHEARCSYLLISAQKRQALIIDPVLALAERIANIVQGQNLQLLAIIDTHPSYEDQSASAMLRTLLAERLVHIDIDELGWPRHSELLPLADYQLSRLATPGHTAAAQTILLQQQGQLKAAFVGDVLLPGGIGRTDLAGGNALALQSSIRKLADKLSEHTLLLSSHDYAQRFATTLMLARQESPLFCAMLAGEPLPCWQASLEAQAQQLQQASSHLCGLVDVTPTDATGLISSTGLADLLTQQPGLQVVDVREPYEQSAGALASYLATCCPILSVPLSALIDALLQQRLQPAQPLLLVCRSGNRSMLAARVLRRLGFESVYNLQGGVALLS
ncbi:aminotransferase class V-fold PLP-dependent enzyme [Arsukibacterium sp.]|uniref:aminotransferase class V-fold PLP-dependent enzyme n=1 Tax=Arsukibacterium sp. TaxID=1977258 RepID=UPI002FD8EB02